MPFATLLIGLMLHSSLSSQQVRSPAAVAEQVDFSTEGDVSQSIPLPPAIRKALEENQFVRETLQSASPVLTSLPEDWTKCSIIHLASTGESDYIVFGQKDLAGAHATHFWIDQGTPTGPKLVMLAFADGIHLDRIHAQGLRKIVITNLTGVSTRYTRYRYNGREYVLDH